MGLFDLFTKKPSGPTVRDLSWINKQGKWNGCLKLIAENPNAVLVSWFVQTAAELIHFAESKNKPAPEIRNAHYLSASAVENKTVIFLEHHPLFSKEENLLKDWKAKQVYVLNSMDDSLFEHVGGQNIADLMRKLGMQEDESIENTMISKSIRKLQDKIEKAITVENPAQSVEEWFARNQ